MLELEDGRWLTYVELGQLLEVTPGAARMYARRRGWPHRTPNAYGDRARVLVPAEAIVQPRQASTPYANTRVQEESNGPDQVNVQLFNALREQMAIANRRIDELTEERRCERRLIEEERSRNDQLREALDDARTAAGIAAGEAAALRGEIDRRRSWKLLRRLGWAPRGR